MRLDLGLQKITCANLWSGIKQIEGQHKTVTPKIQTSAMHATDIFVVNKRNRSTCISKY